MRVSKIFWKNFKSKNVCWHDMEGEHFVQARCSRNRLWSRTPFCWFNTLHVRVFIKFAEKNSKSQNVCWNFFDFFLNIQVSYFYFLEDSAKFHRNIPYVLYALKMCVFPKYSEKILSPKMCVDMTRKVSTSFRLGVAETACEVGLLCADSIPYMSACLENLQKKILSPKMCVEIFLIFFKYTKVSYF